MVDNSRVNILVTGTPGVGKTTFCQQVAEKCQMNCLDVAALIRDERLYTEWDDEMNCSIFDEEMVLDALRDKLSEGGYILDFHSVAFLSDESFALIVVLRTDNTILFDRLTERGYSDSKVSENVECEIFQIVAEETRHAFEDTEIEIVEFQNDNMEQLKENVHTVYTKIRLANPQNCGE